MTEHIEMVAVVTGAASGIGLATARQLASDGDDRRMGFQVVRAGDLDVIGIEAAADAAPTTCP